MCDKPVKAFRSEVLRFFKCPFYIIVFTNVSLVQSCCRLLTSSRPRPNGGRERRACEGNWHEELAASVGSIHGRAQHVRCRAARLARTVWEGTAFLIDSSRRGAAKASDAERAASALPGSAWRIVLSGWAVAIRRVPAAERDGHDRFSVRTPRRFYAYGTIGYWPGQLVLSARKGFSLPGSQRVLGSCRYSVSACLVCRTHWYVGESPRVASLPVIQSPR